jgi:hypothetical protein
MEAPTHAKTNSMAVFSVVAAFLPCPLVLIWLYLMASTLSGEPSTHGRRRRGSHLHLLTPASLRAMANPCAYPRHPRHSPDQNAPVRLPR